MTDLTQIYHEWQNNPVFKKNFKENPEEALRKAGFELSKEDLDKIKSYLQLNGSNEKLDDRINK